MVSVCGHFRAGVIQGGVLYEPRFCRETRPSQPPEGLGEEGQEDLCWLSGDLEAQGAWERALGCPQHQRAVLRAPSGKQQSHPTFATCPDLPPLTVWLLLTCVTQQQHPTWDLVGRNLSTVRQRTGSREWGSPLMMFS